MIMIMVVALWIVGCITSLPRGVIIHGCQDHQQLLKRCSIEITGPNVCQENIPHTITPLWSACTFDTATMWPWTHTAYAKSWLYHQHDATGTVIRRTTPQLSSGDRVPTSRFFIFFSDNPVWASAAIARPWQGSASCALRDSLLHTTFVLCHYLPVCGLPVSLQESCHSPSTSHQWAVFTHRTADDWMFFVCCTILSKS
jgi:hypothetical protein